ncbi:hypothetical protein GPX89_34055 [Nocardia sp. ET3-3]|uniref:Uncharacterized protein n=1 Tax=Nocardia terrae TaxID=2675851 RepID=A0A7K1V823_9NOCA|nr:hypothetical protein [Nocardia terrae]MVU82248.1 hypothetical protein [Nocardia terrae]
MKWRRSRDNGEQRAQPEPVREPVAPVRAAAVSPVRQRFHERLTAADAEPEPSARARAMLAGVHEFLALAEDAEILAERAVLLARAGEIGAATPDAGVRLVSRLRGWFGLDEKLARQVLGAWMARPEAASFGETWSAASELMTTSEPVGSWVTTAVLADNSVVSATFRELARTHLVEMVDADFGTHEFTGSASPVWQVLYALGPATRPEWFVLFGDRAAGRGEEAEAARRYELADRFGGGTQARERLKKLHDIGAHQRLLNGATAADALRGPGTPSPYRQLLIGTAAVMTGRPASAALSEAGRDGDENVRRAAGFVSALDRLRDGDEQTARTRLRGFLADTTVADGPGANARLVLGALDGDDELLTAGARMLLARYREHWPTHSMVAPATVLTAVSRTDSGLLTELIGDADAGSPGAGGDLDAMRVATARTYLAEAARAALFSRFEETDRLLTQARQLLAGAEGDAANLLRDTATRIADTIDRMRAKTSVERPLDRLAFAALREDGTVQPWTPTALRLWQDYDAATSTGQRTVTRAAPHKAAGAAPHDVTGIVPLEPSEAGPCDATGTGPRTLHHLAIAEHARAYQLEIAGDDTAFEHWRRAIGYWARLGADDRFWDDLRTRLTATAGDTTPEEVAIAVDEARGELPAQVLDPHVTLVLQLRKDDLPRARAHLDLIRTAAFAPADIDRARARLAREAGAGIRRLVREGDLDRALAEVRAWIDIDSDNIPLAEQALDVGIETAETEHRRSDREWAERARPVLERIADLVDPMRARLGLTSRQLSTGRRPATGESDRMAFAAKLARHEFWHGTSLLFSTYDRLKRNPYDDRTGFRRAAGHLNTALMLGLPALAPYDKARELLVASGKLERSIQGHALGFL